MWRNGLLLLIVSLMSIVLKAQIKNSFTVSNNQEFDKVKFSLNTTNGHCFIEPGQESNLMNIHSNTDGTSQPEYEEKIINRTKEVKVKLDERQNTSLSSTISRRMFSSQSVDDYTWKVYISKLKPMDLDLNYAVGDTYIDLSDLPIERLKMRTGSANVKINYTEGFGNKLEMDTFLIKVDMGTFEAKNLHLSNANNIITDVGFGKVKMDFKDAEYIRSDVHASVGAGKLEIILPMNNIPIRININDSPLCNIKIPEGFEIATDNIYVSPGFEDNQVNQINFNVDVAVGNIVFKPAHH